MSDPLDDASNDDRLAAARMEYIAALALGVVGRDAFARAAALVDQLGHMNPLALEPPPAPHANPHTRQNLRLLCCLVGPHVPDDELPTAVREMVANRWLPYELVKDVVQGGHRGEVPGAKLRAVAASLRAGRSWAATAANVGVSREVIERVSKFLCAPEAVEAKLRAAALRVALHAGTVAQLGREQHVGRHTALRHMAAARATVADLRDDGTLEELGL